MLLFLSDPVVPLNVRKNTILLNTIKTIKLKLLTLPPREGFLVHRYAFGFTPKKAPSQSEALSGREGCEGCDG